MGAVGIISGKACCFCPKSNNCKRCDTKGGSLSKSQKYAQRGVGCRVSTRAPKQSVLIICAGVTGHHLNAHLSGEMREAL